MKGAGGITYGVTSPVTLAKPVGLYVANVQHSSFRTVSRFLKKSSALLLLMSNRCPRWTPENRPVVDGANPASGEPPQARELYRDGSPSSKTPDAERSARRG